MEFKKVIFTIILYSWLSIASAENVKVVIQGATSIAKIDDNFICAIIDWWPNEKCNYSQCLWKNVGLFDIDLNMPILANTIKAFNPLRIRVGGSLQDQVVYNVGSVNNCPHFQKREDDLLGSSQGCLSMERWDEINNFFNQTGAKVTFGMNALIGRNESNIEKGLWIGNWQPQNARDFMNYIISKGYKIDSYEFGNGLSGGEIGPRVEAKQYGKDVITLKNLVKELNRDPNSQLEVLGPNGFYDDKWFNTFLEVSRQEVVDAITHCIYNQGPGNDPNLITKIQDPFYLNQVVHAFKNASKAANKFESRLGAWVSEACGASDSGRKDVYHTFANGFWYFAQLGMASTFNQKVFCKQTFIGGNFAFLNGTTFSPNPNYFGALLWHRLMGSTVLSTTQNVDSNLHTYAHCAKKKLGISLLFINLSKDKTFNVTLSKDEKLHTVRRSLISKDAMSRDFEFVGYQNREEYHLTPLNNDIQSDVVLLNDVPLALTVSLDVPSMDPNLVGASAPISIAPYSIVFATIRDFQAPACA